MTKRIRYLYFKTLLQQDISFFDEKMNGTGALTARLSDDAEKIQGLTATSMGSIIQLISSMGTAIGLAFYHGWQMTLVVLACVPILALGGILESKATWKSSNDPTVRKAYASASQTACDAIANIRTVKSLTIEDELVQQYMNNIELPFRRGIKEGWIGSLGFGNYLIYSIVALKFYTFLAFSQASQFWIYAIAFYAGYRFVFAEILNVQDMFTVLFSIIFGAIAFSQAAQLNSNSKSKIIFKKLCLIFSYKGSLCSHQLF